MDFYSFEHSFALSSPMTVFTFHLLDLDSYCFLIKYSWDYLHFETFYLSSL